MIERRRNLYGLAVVPECKLYGTIYCKIHTHTQIDSPHMHTFVQVLGLQTKQKGRPAALCAFTKAVKASAAED